MAGRKVLKPQWVRFAIEYVKGGNAADAYLLAGYKCKSIELAQSSASQLLKNPTVVALVDKERNRVQKKLEISSEKVFREIARLAFSSASDLHNEDGTLKTPTEWDEDTAAAVSSLEYHPDGSIKEVRRWDKPGQLKLLARLLGLIKPREADQSPQPVNVNLQVNNALVDLSSLSVEELRQLRDLRQRLLTRSVTPPVPASEPRSGDGSEGGPSSGGEESV